MDRPKILIVEDENIVAMEIQERIKSLGYEVSAVVSRGEDAVQKTAECHPDLVLMDIMLRGELDGITAAKQIRERYHVPVIYLTAYSDHDTLQRAKITEPFGYLLKPFEERELHTTIEMALYKHKMEKKLKESEKWLATTLRSIGDAVIATDAQGRIIFMNPVTEALTGWKQEEALGKDLTEVFNIINEKTRQVVENPVARVFRKGVVVGLANHTVLIAKDGTERPIDDSAAPIKDEKGNIIGAVLVFRDITERRRADEALVAEQKRLSVTLNSIGDGVITTDTQGKILTVNRVAEKITGWTQEEAIGKALSEVFNIRHQDNGEPFKNPIDMALKSGKMIELSKSTRLLNRHGKEHIISLSAAPIRDENDHILGGVLAFQDVTEQFKLEEELRKAHKLESLGILAGGIAHDFNNILTSIVGNITLAKTQTKPQESIYQRLTEAEKACQRAKDLTQQLLTFAKGGAPIKRTASIKEIIEDTTEFVLRGSTVRCEYRISDNLWPVEVDEGQISQVINNLVINSIQAMPQGGTIKVTAENTTIDNSHDEKGVLLRAGEYVKLTIKDEGIGIPPEHLALIFDPYFTTKQKGSGLGLSICYSVIKKHGGYIMVDSKLGVGSTFTIYLPANPTANISVSEHEEKITTGHGKILVMDDEEAIQEVAGQILQYLGYEVQFAKDGAEAIALYKEALEKGKPFDAVIMDLTIPGGLGGKETIQELRKIDPSVNAIVSSGYSKDPVMANYWKYGFSGCLSKPYNIQELSKILRKMIYSIS